MSALGWLAFLLVVIYAGYEAVRQDWQIASYWSRKVPSYREPKRFPPDHP